VPSAISALFHCLIASFLAVTWRSRMPGAGIQPPHREESTRQ
jgi:hypothetical protein